MGDAIETKIQSNTPISQPIAEIKLSLEQIIDEKIKVKIPDQKQRDDVTQSCKELQDELKQPLDGFIKDMKPGIISKLSKLLNPQEIKSFLRGQFNMAHKTEPIQTFDEADKQASKIEEKDAEVVKEKTEVGEKDAEVQLQVEKLAKNKELGKETLNLANTLWKNLDDKFKANSDQYIKDIQYKINGRPRKKLNYDNPKNKFYNFVNKKSCIC